MKYIIHLAMLWVAFYGSYLCAHRYTDPQEASYLTGHRHLIWHLLPDVEKKQKYFTSKMVEVDRSFQGPLSQQDCDVYTQNYNKWERRFKAVFKAFYLKTGLKVVDFTLESAPSIQEFADNTTLEDVNTAYCRLRDLRRAGIALKDSLPEEDYYDLESDSASEYSSQDDRDS